MKYCILYSDFYRTTFINQLHPECIREDDIIDMIKNERKVLKILIEKKPNLEYLMKLDCNTYNKLFSHTSNSKITEDEYKLIKLVFEEYFK